MTDSVLSQYVLNASKTMKAHRWCVATNPFFCFCCRGYNCLRQQWIVKWGCWLATLIRDGKESWFTIACATSTHVICNGSQAKDCWTLLLLFHSWMTEKNTNMSPEKGSCTQDPYTSIPLLSPFPLQYEQKCRDEYSSPLTFSTLYKLQPLITWQECEKKVIFFLFSVTVI